MFSSILLIRFDLNHALNSTAEGFNVNAIFYFPPYVQMNQIVLTNSSFTYTVNDSAVFFTVFNVELKYINQLNSLKV